MNLLGEALLSLQPPIKSLYNYSSNPAVVAPNVNKVKVMGLKEKIYLLLSMIYF